MPTPLRWLLALPLSALLVCGQLSNRLSFNAPKTAYQTVQASFHAALSASSPGPVVEALQAESAKSSPAELFPGLGKWKARHDVRQGGCQTVLVLGGSRSAPNTTLGLGLFDAINPVADFPKQENYVNRWNTYWEREAYRNGQAPPKDLISYDGHKLAWTLWINSAPAFGRFPEHGPTPPFPPLKRWKSLHPNNPAPAPYVFCNDLFPATYYDMPFGSRSLIDVEAIIPGFYAFMETSVRKQQGLDSASAAETGCRTVQLLGSHNGQTTALGLYDIMPNFLSHTWAPYIFRGSRVEDQHVLMFSPEHLAWLRLVGGEVTHYFRFSDLSQGPPPPNPPTAPWLAQAPLDGAVVPLCADLFHRENPEDPWV